jgi:hypothetical protein
VRLDRCPDPPHGVGRETEPALGLESSKRLHQPDVALGDQIGKRHPVAAKPSGDLDHETQVAAEQLLGGLRILGIAPISARRLSSSTSRIGNLRVCSRYHSRCGFITLVLEHLTSCLL